LNPAATINVKILSLGTPERYALRRLVMAAQNELKAQLPDLDVRIAEVRDSSEIGKYALVLVLPTLVINERVVCSGQFPTKGAVVAWLRKALG